MEITDLHTFQIPISQGQFICRRPLRAISLFDPQGRTNGSAIHYRSNKDIIYLAVYLRAVGRLYGNHEINAAVNLFHKTIGLYPQFFFPRNSVIALDVIARWDEDVFIKQKDILWETVFRNLPDALQGRDKFRQAVFCTKDKIRFYNAYDNRRWSEIPKLWWKIWSADKKWILNKGGNSILLQSLGLWHRPINDVATD
jgi:hypothetical protein